MSRQSHVKPGWARSVVGTAAAAALSATPVVAQDDARSSDPIVVVGEREIERSTIERQVKAISGTHQGHLPRFEAPVCLGIHGLAQDAAETVIIRFRRTAQSANIDLADPPCKANLLVLVLDEPKAFLTEFKKRKPIYFSELRGPKLRRLMDSPGPVWVWRGLHAQRDDGGPVTKATAMEDGRGMARGAIIATNVQMGRMRSPIRFSTDQTFMVLDRASLVGVDSDQLGDFIAMAGLIDIDFRRIAQLPEGTILRLFEDGSGASSASAYDRAFLSALYAGEGGRTATQKISEISGRMQRELDER